MSAETDAIRNKMFAAFLKKLEREDREAEAARIAAALTKEELEREKEKLEREEREAKVAARHAARTEKPAATPTSPATPAPQSSALQISRPKVFRPPAQRYAFQTVEADRWGCGDAEAARQNASVVRQFNKRANKLLARAKAIHAKRAVANSPALPDKNYGRPHPLVLLAKQTQAILLRLVDLEERVARWEEPQAANAVSEDRHDLSINGQINEAMEARAIKGLDDHANSAALLFTIDSGGGSADAALNIFEALSAHRATKKTALVTGRCCSAAILLLMAADVRLAFGNSEFLIHHTSPTDAQNIDHLQSCAGHDAYELEIARGLGIDEARFVALRASGQPFGANEALELGLLTRIAGEDDLDELF